MEQSAALWPTSWHTKHGPTNVDPLSVVRGVGDSEYGAGQLVSPSVSPPGGFWAITGVAGCRGAVAVGFLLIRSRDGHVVVPFFIAATSWVVTFFRSALGFFPFFDVGDPLSLPLDDSTTAAALCEARWGRVYVVPGIFALSRREGEWYHSLIASLLSNSLPYFSMDSKLSNLLSHR